MFPSSGWRGSTRLVLSAHGGRSYGYKPETYQEVALETSSLISGSGLAIFKKKKKKSWMTQNLFVFSSADLYLLLLLLLVLPAMMPRMPEKLEGCHQRKQPSGELSVRYVTNCLANPFPSLKRLGDLWY